MHVNRRNCFDVVEKHLHFKMKQKYPKIVKEVSKMCCYRVYSSQIYLIGFFLQVIYLSS